MCRTCPGPPLTHPGASLTLSSGLVSTLVCMPAVLPIGFFSALTCTKRNGLDPTLWLPA